MPICRKLAPLLLLTLAACAPPPPPATQPASRPAIKAASPLPAQIAIPLLNAANFVMGARIGPQQSLLGAAIGFGGLFQGGSLPIFHHSILQFPNNPLMRKGGGALTLGHFQLYAGGANQKNAPYLGPNTLINDRVNGRPTGLKQAQDHEDAHVLQSDCLGNLYIPANLLSMALGILTSPPGTSLGEATHGKNAFMETGPQMNPPVPFPGPAAK